MRLKSLALVVLLALAPFSSLAQEAKGLGDWSVVGAQVNTGKAYEDVQVGWPNVNFGYTFSMGKSSDLGIRFGLLYGLGGTTLTQFGLGLWAPIRFQLVRGSGFNMLLHVDPGVQLYFGSSTCNFYYCGTTSNTIFGFQAPVGIVGGFPVARNVEVGFGLDLNMALNVTTPVTFVIGPWAGPYVEYHLDNPNLALGLNTRFGVAIPTSSGSSALFAFQVQAFVGYRLF
ncbi:MAG: hypothetical protein WCK73_10885 [Deltaproteobacteria bacterium]